MACELKQLMQDIRDRVCSAYGRANRKISEMIANRSGLLRGDLSAAPLGRQIAAIKKEEAQAPSA